MGETILGIAAGLRLQCGIDFGVADADPALREALAQALYDDLIAQRAAEVGEAQTVFGQLLAQLFRGELVFTRDIGDGRIDFFVGDAHAGGGCARGLQSDQDQAFQHLALQHIGGRQLGLAARVLAADVGDGAFEFALQDDVLIHHRGDPVQRLLGEGGGGADEKRAGENHGSDGAAERSDHGTESEEGSSPPPRVWGGGTRDRSSR